MVKGTTINDPSTQDPSNGGTSPQGYVNISSGTPDGSMPSSYITSDGTTMFIRFRLEGDPNAYVAGHSASASDPWTSAQWTLMLDVNGDGWRDFALFLDGSSGTPGAPVDKISIIYSRLTNSQSIDYGVPGIYLVNQIYAAQQYTSGPYNGDFKEYDGNGGLKPVPWSTNKPTVYDYGTTRVMNKTATGEGYFLDFQIPLALLDATPFNGPKVTGATIMTGSFSTSNSLNDPWQKDFSYVGAFCANSTLPMPGGDPINLNNETLPKLIVTDITATYCPLVDLTTKISTAQRLTDCGTVVSSVVTTNFYYWRDENSNRLADESGGTWVYIGAGNAASLGVWTAQWNTESLPKGQYLIKVIGVDQNGNSSDSYLQTVASYPKIYAVVANNCGIIPAVLSKTVTPSTVSANETPANRTVTYTITVTNPQSADITLDTLFDQLPSTFSYVSNASGGTLTPSISPTAGATGTVWWKFSPAAVIGPGQSKTLTFNVLAGTTPGTYSNSAYANGSTSFNTLMNVAPVAVTNAAAMLSKSISTSAGLNPGQQYIYTLTYSNTGSIPLTNVVVTDSLVQGITFVSASASGTYDAATKKAAWNLGTLAAGATGSLSMTIAVTAPYSGTNPLINSAVLRASELATNVVSNTVSSTVLGPTLSLSKSVSPSSAFPGNNVTYTILYGNVGTGAATSVTVTDTLPPNLTFVAGTAMPSAPVVTTLSNPTRQVLTWTIGTIAAGGGNLNNSISFQANIVNPYPTVGANQLLENKVVIRSNETAPYQYVTPLLVTAIPSVSLTKTSDLTVYAASDSATFTFTLVNTGYYAATLDTLEDALPNGFVFGWTSGGTLAPTTRPTAGATGTVRWRFSPAVTIQPNATATLVFRVRVPAIGVNYTNVGRARGILVTAAQDVITSELPLTVAEGSEAISKNVDKSRAFQGDTLTYTIYYLNNSGTSRTRAIMDTLPASLTFVSETHTRGTFVRVGQVLTWSPGSVANGASAGMTVKAVINTSGTTVVNKASFSSAPVTYSNVVTTIADSPPSILFGKSVNITAAPINTELTYTLTYSNAAGVAPSTNTIVVDTIPATMNYVAGSATGGGAFIATPAPKGSVVWNLGTVGPNTSGSLTFKATIDPSAVVGSVITNTAYFTDNEGIRRTASAKDTVKALPNFDITKTVDRISAGPADTLTYSIQYRNSGQAAAASVVIADSIPANTVFVSATNGGTLSGGRVTWTIGAVAVNASGTVTLKVRIPSPLAVNSIAQISNRATISATGIQDRTTNAVLTNVIYPQLTVLKSADSTTATAGTQITYTLTVSNASICEGTGTVLTDAIPARSTYVANSTALNGVPVADIAGVSPLVSGMAVGTVTASSPATVTFKVLVTIPAQNGALITNQATATTAKLTDIISSNTVNTTIRSYPKMTFTKSVDRSHAKPGDTLTYTLTYQNVGGSSAAYVNITDPKPVNLTYIPNSVAIKNADPRNDPATFTAKTDGADGDEVSAAESIITIDIGIVAPGQSGIIRYQFRVNDQ